MDLPPSLFAVYAVYFLAVASPGPSNMMIMAVAMGQGRRAALVLAAGVVTGSLTWALLTAAGLSAVLTRYAHALTAIKIAGGLYLLYLACRCARAALARTPGTQGPAAAASRLSAAALYRRGLLMHLSNPKAILTWIALMSVGLQAGQPRGVLSALIAGCAAIALAVFGGYAILFSTGPAVQAYRQGRRAIETVLAGCLGLAGIKTLTWNG